MSGTRLRRAEAWHGWLLIAPGLAAIAAIIAIPVGWTIWESLHHHDLRMPWLGRPFVGLQNYVEAAGDARFVASAAHAAFFALTTVAIEMVLGTALALALNTAWRGRAALRGPFRRWSPPWSGASCSTIVPGPPPGRSPRLPSSRSISCGWRIAAPHGCPLSSRTSGG
jgi:hypothetical protein